MYGLNMAVVYVIQTLGSLYLVVVLLRFILQLVKADFYNQLSQFIVKATQPLVAPMRRIIPSMGRMDLASVVLAVLLQMALLAVIIVLMGYALPNVLQLLIWSVIAVAGLFLRIFFFALLINIILSWVAPRSNNPAAILIQQICEPVMSPIRRVIPPLGGLDLSPIFAFIVLNLLSNFVIGNLAVATGMPSGLAIGV